MHLHINGCHCSEMSLLYDTIQHRNTTRKSFQGKIFIKFATIDIRFSKISYRYSWSLCDRYARTPTFNLRRIRKKYCVSYLSSLKKKGIFISIYINIPGIITSVYMYIMTSLKLTRRKPLQCFSVFWNGIEILRNKNSLEVRSTNISGYVSLAFKPGYPFTLRLFSFYCLKESPWKFKKKMILGRYFVSVS